MVDKNRNGIDDRLEGSRSTATKPKPKPEGISAFFNDVLQGPVRGISNFAGTLGAWLASRPAPARGTNAGDQMFGVPGAGAGRGRSAWRGGGGGTFGPPPPEPEPTVSPSLLDFLSQATGIVDQLGIGGAGGGFGGVDYSGAMANARSERDRNAQMLGQVYNQLRAGLAEDRAGYAENYGGAIDRSQEIAQNAQNVTRDAFNAAATSRDEAAARLGLENALASQKLDRPTLEAQAADAIADSAARAQNAQTMYNTHQANATTHSQNVQDASRYSEANAIAGLDQSLTDRLTELAQLQAEANAQAAMRNAGGQSDRASAILSLGQSLYGDAMSQSQQDFENQLAAAELAASQRQAPSYTLERLLQGQQQSGLNNRDYVDFMKLLATLNRSS